MPTKEQLFRMWESDFRLGHIDDRGSEHDAFGDNSSGRIPDIIRRQRENPKGTKLGEFRIVDGEMRLIPNKEL